jgi:hypothetical protein
MKTIIGGGKNGITSNGKTLSDNKFTVVNCLLAIVTLLVAKNRRNQE